MDKETRQRNAEARRARQEARYAQEKKDRALVLEALRAILRDNLATVEQRIFAVGILDSMENYHFIPCSMNRPGGGKRDDDLIAEFARELEKRQEAENK